MAQCNRDQCEKVALWVPVLKVWPMVSDVNNDDRAVDIVLRDIALCTIHIDEARRDPWLLIDDDGKEYVEDVFSKAGKLPPAWDTLTIEGRSIMLEQMGSPTNE